MTFRAFFPLLSSAALALCSHIHAQDAQDSVAPESLRAQVFGWPFVEWEKMQPRGGTTQGSDVTLLTEAKKSWKDLQATDLTKVERDRRAILALAGSYRVSFDFLETSGTEPAFSPSRPYFSWATEHVTVLNDAPTAISLQHTLVMYFEKDGEVSGPHLMKHWRQDWQYEDTELHTYRGDLVWKQSAVSSPEGRWSQSVYQVDDSPRYQVMGTWTHEPGLSQWTSDDSWRPLPRREFSVRDDYNVLGGTHTIALNPTGWIHVQNNRKLKVGSDGQIESVLGTEIGISRYEEITEPDLATDFAAEWAKTAPYWAEVRGYWDELFASHDTIRLRETEGGEKLWQVHFGDAVELTAAVPDEDFDPKAAARAAIDRFLIKD